MAFWKWWTIAVLSVTAFAVSDYFFGLLNYLIETDKTLLSFVIIAIGVGCTLVMGFLSYCKQFNKREPSENYLQPLWYFSEAVMSIGMVGTLLGFLLVLTTAFEGVDTTDVNDMKEVISNLASGMGIALTTSLCGLITSIWLKLQLVILENSHEEV